MAEEDVVLVQMRRKENSKSWGFRMQGGKDRGQMLYINKVNAKSLAERSGLQPGDGIVKIGNVPAHYLTHEQAKMEILRQGNELDFLVKRNAVTRGVDRTEQMARERAEVREESTEWPQAKGFQNPTVQSRSFRILQETLHYSEPTPDTAIPSSN